MYKSKLQELCHKHSWNLPLYTTVKDGPDHCPRFTTTLTLNGIQFQSPHNESKSSKEAQNIAAKLAFDDLSSSGHHLSFPEFRASPPSPSVPSPLPASSNKVVVGPAKNEVLQENHGGIFQNSIANDASLYHKDDSKPKDLLHLYKNRLQHYAQKNNLSLPEYSCEFVGPPHARQFRASVMINERTYQSSEYYSTLKDAEHAAAKTALESLSIVEIQENEGLFKTLLQEFTQKEGLRFPSYSIIRSGPSHMPTFVSTVEVDGEIYQGVECKTKKQSEMSAAKVAYEKLIERIAISNCSPLSTSSKNVDVPCLRLQPITSDNGQQVGAKITPENHLKRAAEFCSSGEVDRHSSILSAGSDGKETLELSSSSLNYVATSASLGNIQPKLAHTVKENLDGEVEGDQKNAKRYRCSSSENMCHHLPEAFPPSSTFSNALSSCSMPSELVKFDEARPAGGSNPPGTKILIFRRGSTMEIPEGASLYHDDKWVAMRVELNQDQQV